MKRLSLLLLSLCALADSVNANHCQEVSADCAEIGRWKFSVAVGVGEKTNPLEGRKDIPLLVLPSIQYTGERFFLQNLDMGMLLIDNQAWQLNALLVPSYDQAFFNRWNASNFFISDVTGMKESYQFYGPQMSVASDVNSPRVEHKPNLHKRRMTALAGLEASYVVDNWHLQTQWLYDVLDTHNGYEWRTSVDRQFSKGRHHGVVTLGAQWQSEAVLDYYYGVGAEESVWQSKGYVAGSGLSTQLSSEYRYQLSEQWSLRLFASYKYLASPIRHSPLVNENAVTTVFMGGVYHF